MPTPIPKKSLINLGTLGILKIWSMEGLGTPFPYKESLT